MREINEISFKPCYKWITFNTEAKDIDSIEIIIQVLNLVINGLPSIQLVNERVSVYQPSFKPCYKWITFNTMKTDNFSYSTAMSFKPCYKWITFNTS